MRSETTLPQQGRYVVLAAGFFGWLLAGVQLAVSSVVMRDAAKSLLIATSAGQVLDEKAMMKWFGWLTAGFLLGGAAGGYAFGAVGDRLGRKTAMALSIATYSCFAGLTYFVATPSQLLILRFLVGLGVGGMWPNGIALVSEAWPGMSRPMLAGVIGTAANVGIMLFSILTIFVHVTEEHWRWVMLLTSTPVLLAALVWFFVPESERWRAAVKQRAAETAAGAASTASPQWEVFQTSTLRVTLLGITLGTIPLFGGWGSANWANAWASKAGEKAAASADEGLDDAPAARSAEQSEGNQADPALKAYTLLARSGPGSLASLLGGAIASLVGRRRFYFFLAVACLVCSQYLFRFSHPGQPDFLWGVAALGLFSGFFFGWLPLCLPELFPTRIRATGAGVSFNFGRIATAIGIMFTAALVNYFDGDYGKIGQQTSWIYAIGVVAICFAPDMGKKGLED